MNGNWMNVDEWEEASVTWREWITIESPKKPYVGQRERQKIVVIESLWLSEKKENETRGPCLKQLYGHGRSKDVLCGY